MALSSSPLQELIDMCYDFSVQNDHFLTHPNCIVHVWCLSEII